MHYTLLKAKLHRARVTQAELEYEGSCAIDGELMDRVGILEHEQIHIYNVSNGERLITYAIRAPNGSRTICTNGAAAHLAKAGDIVIICSYAQVPAQQAPEVQPKVAYLDANNHITGGKHIS